MTARRIGLILGPLAFALTALLPPPEGMEQGAWLVAGLVLWMAAWWMTEAVPLTVTALLPFVVLPLVGVSDADKVASTYYSPILFLLLGGAFIALAIERTGLHRRLSLAILRLVGAQGEVVGIDRDPVALELARRRVGEAGLTNIIFAAGDFAAIGPDQAGIDDGGPQGGAGGHRVAASKCCIARLYP